MVMYQKVGVGYREVMGIACRRDGGVVASLNELLVVDRPRDRCGEQERQKASHFCRSRTSTVDSENGRASGARLDPAIFSKNRDSLDN